jgi:HSP20 family protein
MGEKKEKEREGRAIAPWRPFGDLERWPGLWEGFFPGRTSRLMNELFREWPATARGGGFVPAVELTENDSNYTITVEIPGVQKNDVQVELQEGMLVVHGEKKSEREEKKDRSRYVERSYGSFSRAFDLPADADADRLEASFKDGVLTVKVPRKEAVKPKQIAIKG